MDHQNESILSIMGRKAITLFKNHGYGLIGLAVLMLVLWLAYIVLAELVPAIARGIVDLGDAVQSGARDIARAIHIPRFNIRRPSDLVEICIWLGVGLFVLTQWRKWKRRR